MEWSKKALQTETSWRERPAEGGKQMNGKHCFLVTDWSCWKYQSSLSGNERDTWD